MLFTSYGTDMKTTVEYGQFNDNNNNQQLSITFYINATIPCNNYKTKQN